MSFAYPTNTDLMLIEQEKLPRLIADRTVFDFFRIVEKRASSVTWDQKDSYLGLQQVRGLNGQPSRVMSLGGRRFEMQPGYYGDWYDLNEQDLTTRRQYGTANTPVDISDLVMEGSEYLQNRFLDRVEYNAWNAVSGLIQVFDKGRILHQDVWSPQTYAAAFAWSDPVHSTPLQDMRNCRLLQRGQSASFGSNAKLYINQQQADYAMANTNPADLYGKRTSGLATIMTMDQINVVLAGEGLPQIVVYDEGYLADLAPGVDPSTLANFRSQFQPFIPLGKGYLIGKRPGNAPVGEYVMTTNINNPDGKPGQYTKIIDKGETEVPRSIQVHNGHNGGPAIMYPGAVVIMSI